MSNTWWDIIRASRDREARQFQLEVAAEGMDLAEFTGTVFAEWMQTAKPEEVVIALQSIARAPTPVLKSLKAAKIAGAWE